MATGVVVAGSDGVNEIRGVATTLVKMSSGNRQAQLIINLFTGLFLFFTGLFL